MKRYVNKVMKTLFRGVIFALVGGIIYLISALIKG